MNTPKENNLKELIRNAEKLQKITDGAIEKTLEELKKVCKNKKSFEAAEEAVLLFIYEGTDINDKEITLEDLMKNITKI